MTISRAISFVAALTGIAAIAAAAPPQAAERHAATANPGIVSSDLPPGYLVRASLPDSLALLPPPPSAGSAAFARDEEARISVAGLRGTARWDRAAADAVLTFPQAAEVFSCAAGAPIGVRSTPKISSLLGKMMIDLALSTYAAKEHYQRTRPFVLHGEGTCAPGDEAMLRNDGSYPSGHSAIGWGWALVLAEMDPAHADAILQRGRDFGQSRLVCGAHWQSDIDAGRVVAAAAVARLHADDVFRADLDAARRELLAAHAMANGHDCAAEASALTATN